MSRLSQARNILLLLTALLVICAFLVVKTSMPLNHLYVVYEQIYQLKVDNDRVEALLFKLKNRNLEHYDDLSNIRVDHQSLYEGLQVLIDDNDNLNQQALMQMKMALQDKSQQVEGFKSTFAIYKNSLMYLPILFRQLAENADVELQRHLLAFEAALFRYTMDILEVSRLHGKLDELTVFADGSGQWQNFIRHADYVISHHVGLNELVGNVSNHPGNELVDRFHDFINLKLQQQLQLQQGAMWGFFTVALALLLYSINTLFLYRKVNSQIQQLNNQLEQKVEQATESLKHEKSLAQQANIAKGRFLTRISHELRTPLNAILGFAQLQQLQMNEQTSIAHRQQTEQILFSGEHLLALINEILDVVSMDEHNMELTIEPCQLHQVIEQAVTGLKPIARVSDIEVSVDCEHSIEVMTDKVRLGQVLNNLLSNAIKFNFYKGKVAITALDLLQGQIKLSIEDSGVGIAEQELNLIFEPFTRLEYAEKNEISGTGIGLTLVQRLINAMNGQLEVTSTPGKGSCFSLYLPLVKRQDIAATKTNIPAQRTPESSSTLVVMYIEDNPGSIDVVKTFIDSHYDNVQLICCKTAEQGIDVARQRNPALVLMDLNLPKMGGKEALQVFKSDKRLCDSAYYAVTADALPQHIEQGLKMGFSGYITKPVDLKILAQVIERYIPGGLTEVV